MKWLPPTGSTQSTEDGRYSIVKANSQDWIAYEITPFATGNELGKAGNDVGARQLCEEREIQMVALRRRA